MKRIVSGLLLLALLSGCTSAAMQKTPEDSGRDAPLTVVQENMPEDFAVRFTWWYDTDRKNIMDTQEGLLQRDLVTEGTASVEFRPDTIINHYQFTRFSTKMNPLIYYPPFCPITTRSTLSSFSAS